jgi:hypothetical protein
MDQISPQFCLALALGLGVLMLIPAGIISARLLRLIEARHPNAWQALGAPKFGPMSIEKSRRLRQFIRSRAYEDLRDPEINSYGRLAGRLNCVLTIVFWIGVVLMVAILVDVSPSS